VLSFDLDNYGVPVSNNWPLPETTVRYIIPGRKDYPIRSILNGLPVHEDHVLWFQHEYGIWQDNAKFISMLKSINQTKVVSLHSVHFQSRETPYGLRRYEYSFLKALLPNVDAITVFTDGVYEAVTGALPEFASKVYVLRHGMHLYPEVALSSRSEAREQINNFLINESELAGSMKNRLRQQRIFLDKDTILIGGSGFITTNKGIEPIFEACNRLKQMLPDKRIAAVFAGCVREADNVIDNEFVAKVKAKYNDDSHFLIDTYLPGDVLPVMLRSLDIHFYWPSDCSQSGIIAHALGTGAVPVCRDMEGVGETVKRAGGLVHYDFEHLINSVRDLMLDSDERKQISKSAIKYAEDFSWRSQVLKHFDLADDIFAGRSQRLVRV
jgi:glycosyltransferase involved in cell wall biosynthesis